MQQKLRHSRQMLGTCCIPGLNESSLTCNQRIECLSTLPHINQLDPSSCRLNMIQVFGKQYMTLNSALSANSQALAQWYSYHSRKRSDGILDISQVFLKLRRERISFGMGYRTDLQCTALQVRKVLRKRLIQVVSQGIQFEFRSAPSLGTWSLFSRLSLVWYALSRN